MHPGGVQLPDAPRAAGDVSLQPGQAETVHVPAQGAPHPANLLADAQVYRDKGVGEVTVTNTVFFFNVLQRSLGGPWSGQEDAPSGDEVVVNRTKDHETVKSGTRHGSSTSVKNTRRREIDHYVKKKTKG